MDDSQSGIDKTNDTDEIVTADEVIFLLFLVLMITRKHCIGSLYS